VKYIGVVEDVPSFLSTFDAVMIPDVAGQGQKQRGFEALRLGLCVAGFPEAFRGLPHGGEPFFIEEDNAENLLQELMAALTLGRARTLGARARCVMEVEFGFEKFQAEWWTLAERCFPLAERIAGRGPETGDLARS
jgi:hypothetical protein